MTFYISLIPVAPSQVDIQLRFVDNIEGSPVKGVVCKVYLNNNLISTSTTDKSGWIYIDYAGIQIGSKLRIEAESNSAYQGGSFNLEVNNLKQKAAFQLQKK